MLVQCSLKNIQNSSNIKAHLKYINLDSKVIQTIDTKNIDSSKSSQILSEV